jgi:ribonucleotide monophosphatase NagD (HAD superfamily)
MNLSFDLDGTLHRDGRLRWQAMGLLRWHQEAGHRVMIVTTRTEAHERPNWWRIYEPRRVVIADFLARYRLPMESVAFTAHQPKATSLKRHEIALHYDDDPAEEAAAVGTNVHVVLLNGVTFHV